MSNTKLALLYFSLFVMISCKSKAQTVDKTYRFDSKESGIFDCAFIVEADSTIRWHGGEGGYAYWGYGKLEKITPTKFVIDQGDQGGVKIKITDEFMRKVHMMDSTNDTLYFYGDDRSFVYRNRIFKLDASVTAVNKDD